MCRFTHPVFLLRATLGCLALCCALPLQAIAADSTPPGDSQIIGQWERFLEAPVNTLALVTLFLDPVSGKQTMRYALDGRDLSEAEALKLGLSSALDIPSAAQAPTQPAVEKAGPVLSPLSRPVWFPSGQKTAQMAGPTVALPPPDMETVRQEDAAALEKPSKGGIRIGILRAFPEPLVLEGKALSWEVLPDGAAYAQSSVYTPGALGVRIAFDRIELPRGAELWLLNEDDSNQGIPMDYGASHSQSPCWSPSCPGERVSILVKVPPDADRKSISLQASQLVHLYLDPIRESWEKYAGACNVDAMCAYASWSEFISAVGGLSTIYQEEALFCTCTLLADNDPCTDMPYVLTANHCVRGQDFGMWAAESLEFYWFYQTNTCSQQGGTAPHILTVPRTTGGADYLAGKIGSGNSGGGTDVTLLRMRNNPPSGVPKMGWTTDVPPVGTPVTVVHHPLGDYKRISHGVLTNSQNNLFPYWYHEVVWNSGTTEHGSSGCALVRDDTRQIIGQLWGGDASCSSPTLPDYFGRFDRSYAVLQPFLETPMGMFSSSAVQVAEDTGAVLCNVSLSRKPAATITIGYEVADGTALQGVDYTNTSGIISFPANTTTGSFSFPLLNDRDSDGNRTIILRLVQIDACAKPNPTNSQFIITQVDDDADADGDGLSDKVEISGEHGGIPTNPNKPDTDSDGLNDYQEVFGTKGYMTDPTNPDTDGDGHGDLQEIQWGLNPLDPSDKHMLSTFTMPWFE